MVLTDKQRKDLHVAFVEYLESCGDKFGDTVAAFRRESGIGDTDCKGKGARKGLLEKKWTAVVRLQKKVMDLEGKVEQLTSDLKSCASGPRQGASAVSADAVPRSPARHALSGHRFPVTCVVFHPVYTLMASASEDATIKLWDYESGQFERTLKGHTNAVQWLCFDKTGRLLASCSADMSIKLWDLKADYACIRTLRGHEHNVSGVAFLPSGDTVVSCSRDQCIKFWEVASGYCTKTIPGGGSGHTEWVRRVTCSWDGSLIATCSNDQTAIVWKVATFEQVCKLTDHSHVVEAVAFCSEAGTKALAKELRKASAVSSAKAAATSGAGAASTGAGAGAGAGAGTSAPSGQGMYLATCSRDKSVRVWDITTETCLANFVEHGSWVRSVAWHPNGKYVVSVSEDKSVRVWEVSTGGCVRKLLDAHQHFITALAVHDSQPVVATGGVDNLLQVWDCR